MYTIIIFILSLITFNLCHSLVIDEGEMVKLNLSFPCGSTKVTLRNSYRPILYSSALPLSSRLDSNLNVVIQNDTEINQCNLVLTIDPVLRGNEGTYILSANLDGIEQFGYSRIWLGVNYGPGKVSCKAQSVHHGAWVILQCEAPKGTLPGVSGQIICYQNGAISPPYGSPRVTHRNIEQAIPVRLNESPVYCCSSSSDEIKDICDCGDFGWNPSYNNFTSTSPCSTTSHPQTPIASDAPTDEFFTTSSSIPGPQRMLCSPYTSFDNSCWLCAIVNLNPLMFLWIVELIYLVVG